MTVVVVLFSFKWDGGKNKYVYVQTLRHTKTAFSHKSLDKIDMYRYITPVN